MSATAPLLDRPVSDVSGRHNSASGVTQGLTLRRLNREIETGESLAALRRLLRALSAHVGTRDTVALAEMVEVLRDEVEQSITDAIAGLRNDPTSPASWAEIGDALGVTRQYAQRRYGHVGGRRRSGGQPGNLR